MGSRMDAPTNAGIDDVRQYWQTHSLYSYEIGETPGTRDYFEAIDRIKREDVERFSLAFWNFEGFAGLRVLDIGCGPGWTSIQYAKAGAQVTSVDLSERAVELTRKHFEVYALDGDVRTANAEALPFADGTFDLVFSSGVLHHTPNTEQAVKEARRVMKPTGRALITLYHKGLLHNPIVFPIVRGGMRLMGVRHPGADLGSESRDVDDFIRMYDGMDNPIGRAYSTRETVALFNTCGFRVVGHELHFFPVRFLPGRFAKGQWLHQLLDRFFGTMIYCSLSAS